ncbi:MAG TPA: hypothetical protein VGE76_04490 [Opitutaceae bacterium]
MNAQTSLPVSSTRRTGRLFLSLSAFALLSSLASAQNTDAPRRRGGDDTGGDRRSFSPAEAQNRMLNALRERMGVTSDEEWGLISDRIQKVTEARRAMGGGLGGPGGPGGMMFGGGPGGARGPGGPGGTGGDRGDRGTGGPAGGFRGLPQRGGSPEQTALTQAVTDKLPDAEIKARLTKLRETRKANEAKLEKAQDELRAVLTVRQEAQAVLLGLLN